MAQYHWFSPDNVVTEEFFYNVIDCNYRLHAIPQNDFARKSLQYRDPEIHMREYQTCISETAISHSWMHVL